MPRSRYTRLNEHRAAASVAWVIFGALISYFLVISALGVLTGR